MVQLDPRSTAAPGPVPQSVQGRRLSPQELHEMRVSWGKKWGKLVSEEVALQLRERG